MDIREICAEKIRAMSDRARYRDFYDLFLILDTHSIDLTEVVNLIPQKEMRQPITKASIKQNWRIVLTHKEMGQIFYSRKVADNAVELMIESLPPIHT